MTLPLSYSRLREPLTSFAASAGWPAIAVTSRVRPVAHDRKSLALLLWPAIRSRERRERLAKDGGEGRTRTFEAARATDLQSAAFDRFATSPAVCVMWKRDAADV